MSEIHPTAIIHQDAKLADDVEVGPGCVIESGVEIGSGSRLREHVAVRRYTTIGERNLIDAFCVLGGEPQDLKFDPATVSFLRIGDDNVFREGVTISRATGKGNATIVGNKTYWMAMSHAGHNATIEDEVILTNGCAVGGHATIGRRTIFSTHVSVHQFCWIGEGVMTQGYSGYSMHVPPFTLTGFGINQLVGLNKVGLRRNPDISDEDREQIKEAFRLLYRSKLSAEKALAEMDARDDGGTAAGKFRDFVRRALVAEPPFNRGICPLRAKTKQ